MKLNGRGAVEEPVHKVSFHGLHGPTEGRVLAVVDAVAARVQNDLVVAVETV
jgi:hypothetical protein